MTPQYKQVVLTTATTGAGMADCSNYNSLVVYIRGSAALSAGTLIIEESDDPNEALTWSQIGSVTLATPFAAAGGKFAYHPQVAAFGWVRCRIGTTVVGGTISVTLGAN